MGGRNKDLCATRFTKGFTSWFNCDLSHGIKIKKSPTLKLIQPFQFEYLESMANKYQQHKDFQIYVDML